LLKFYSKRTPTYCVQFGPAEEKKSLLLDKMPEIKLLLLLLLFCTFPEHWFGLGLSRAAS
jgi:hypothetical protein